MSEGAPPARGRVPRAAITVGAVTHVGMRRSGNQDSYCVLTGARAPSGADALIAVADGMGGHRAGEVASALAVQSLARRLARGGAPFQGPGVHGVRLGQAAEEVNREVHEAAAAPELSGMGTTLTAALLAGEALFLAHVGDSRAYLWRQGELRRLTKDHSWVQEQLAEGLLSPEEAGEHPGRHLLTRALGIGPYVEVDTATLPVQPGDVLLLCSDGLHTLVGDDEIAQVLAAEEPQRACELLIERANARGGNDNVTAVVLRIDRLNDGPPSQRRRLFPFLRGS